MGLKYMDRSAQAQMLEELGDELSRAHAKMIEILHRYGVRPEPLELRSMYLGQQLGVTGHPDFVKALEGADRREHFVRAGEIVDLNAEQQAQDEQEEARRERQRAEMVALLKAKDEV